MKRSASLGILVLLAMIGSLGAARADQAVTITTITGTVTDDAQHPVQNATVTFASSSEKDTTESAVDGTFRITVPAGTYQLTVRAKDFDVVTRKAIMVSDQPLNIQVTLVVSGSLKTIAQVTVRTQSTINVTPAAVNSLTAQQIAAQGSIGLSRVLSEIPGVQITMSEAGQHFAALADEYAVNSPANPVFIQIRGSQAYENATLFDGHRVNSVNWETPTGNCGGQSGAFNLASLDTSGISSLDVVKGPGADSPTDNNAIGGVANIDPGVPSGKPSGMLSYGFDGSGGLKLNINAQGETKNKRLGLSVSSTSYTVAGPIGGFPYFDFDNSPWSLGILNGTEPIVFNGQNTSSVNFFSYKPYLNGGFDNITNSSSIGCCYSTFNRDTSLIQQRNVSLRYAIAPTVQLILRYGLNNSFNNYSNTPSVETFSPPAGYQGQFKNGYQFSQQRLQNVPSREIDQTYEWDIHSQMGKGSLRLSYLSYSSTNDNTAASAYQNGLQVCSNCTLSGIFYVGGTIPSTINQLIANYNTCGDYTCGTPTVFNDKKATLSQGYACFPDYYLESLTHDLVADFLYPVGNDTTVGLSYNATVTSNYYLYSDHEYVNPLYSPLFTPNSRTGNVYSGQFERFNTLHLSLHTALSEKLSGQLSLYVNQYQYHIPNPNPGASPTDFVNKYSYFTSPRFGFEWRPRQDIAVRASAGGGIAPIDVTNLLGQSQVPQPNLQPPSTPTYYTVSLANPNLRPETSFGEDLGTSLRIGRVSTLSADLYNTTLYGQFFSNYELDGMYLGLPLYASQTRNLAHSKYQGIELTYDRHPPTGLFLTLQGSLQRGFAYDLPASFYATSGGPYCTNLTLIANKNFNGGADGIGRVAYAQGFASIGWQNVHGFQTSANFTYYGNNNGFYRPAFVTIDLDGTIPVTDRVSISVALANLTNIYPDLYYQFGQYAVIPYAHMQTGTPYIGQTNTVGNVGPRHVSATMNFKL